MAGSIDRDKTAEKGVSRRKAMLVAGAAAAAAGALIAAPFRTQIRNVARRVAVKSGIGRGFLSLADGTYEERMGEVGTTFSIGGQAGLTLVGVRPLQTAGARPTSLRTQSFAAFFEPTSRRAFTPDLIYTVTHPAYGPLPLYLAAAPVTPLSGRMVAVFN